MVEAIVIMVTMLVFLGMNLFAVKAYGGKLDQATAVRRDVMYYATHNCKVNNADDPDTYTDPALRSAGGATGDGGFVQDVLAMIQGLGGGGATAGMASGTKGSVPVTGSAVIWIQKRALTANLQSSSWVVCNRPPEHARRHHVGLRTGYSEPLLV
jgi:hypothetical protein